MTDTSLLMELRRLLAEKEKVKRAEKAIDDQIAALAGYVTPGQCRKPRNRSLSNAVFKAACLDSGARV